jgi:hypothetical protein
MKRSKTERQSKLAVVSRTMTILVTPLIAAACAHGSKPAETESPDITSGMSAQDAQVVRQARQEAYANRFTEKEQIAIELAVSRVEETEAVDLGTVSNIRVQSVNWPDSSLGCPKPGVHYLQRVVPGYFVSFKAEEKVYTVHVGDDVAVVCDLSIDFLKDRRARTMAIISTQQAARAHLAERLKVEPDEIQVTNLKMVTWPDSSLGCELDGQAIGPDAVEGVQISMTCKDKGYEYRTALEPIDFISCEKITPCHETE